MSTVEIFRFPHALGDPLQGLLSSAAANLERYGHLAWMVLGISETERIAAIGVETEPAHLAAVEGALLALPECLWTVLAGQTPLPSGAGWLNHAFVRQRWADGHWTAWVRPATQTPQGIAWLGDWERRDGDQRPSRDPLFPPPSHEAVVLVRPLCPFTPSWQQELSGSVTAEQFVERLGGFACRWFSAEGTLPPMTIRWIEGHIEGFTLKDDALAEHLAQVAILWAQQPETLAVGTCRRKHWPEGGPGSQQILVVLEVRGGAAFRWVRRYRVQGNVGRWDGERGELTTRVSASARGWLV
jgi:hypothetical protein